MADTSLSDFSLIAARALAYLALLLAAGLPLYLISAGRGAELPRPVRTALIALAVIGAAASAWWALASIAAMTAQPIAELDQTTVTAVLDATPLGMVLTIRFASLLALAVIVLSPLGRWRLPLASLSGAAALATCAYTGHSGASEGTIGVLHRLADEIHLLAAATWLAALAMLLACAFGRTDARTFEARLAGFAKTGTLIVGALVLTGMVNSLAILGWPLPSAFYSSLWAKVLAAKLVLFAGMLGLAALNRWRLTPALAAGMSGAQANLRRSLILESAVALGVLVLVSALGLLDPAG